MSMESSKKKRNVNSFLDMDTQILWKTLRQERRQDFLSGKNMFLSIMDKSIVFFVVQEMLLGIFPCQIIRAY